jgi:hypothetical protein
MKDALKELIARDEWLEVAKAITFAYVGAPKNPAKYSWVSAVEEGPYHIETNDSAANGGQVFKASCSAAGDFNFHLTAAQIFPSQKCKSCVELSGKHVLDVAGQGKGQPSIGSLCVGNEGSGNGAQRDSATGLQRDVPIETPAAHISDRHGDDRFADNILRALEGLPQNGDYLEELAAAEEGAAIEASGYPEPGSNPRFA